MSDLPFLESEEPVIETPEVIEAPAAVEPAEEQPLEGQPRDEGGRFAPKQEPVMVPLAALHETRDKVRDLEARLAAQTQPVEQQVPDIFEDQQGYTAAIQQQVQQAVYAERVNFSRSFAEQKYGGDVVSKALEWGQAKCGSDPYFNATVMANADPVGFAVQQFQREQIASEVDPGEFEKFKAWKAAQAQTQQQEPQAQTPTPPRSLASLPSSGGAAHIPVGPGQAFDTLFK